MKRKVKDYLFVSIQIILFLCFLFDFNWSLQLELTTQNLGLIISILGVIVTILALLQLNKNLSPFPTPKKSATLLQNGLYKYVRHPIYTGIILLFSGYSMYENSVYKMLISVLLVILFYLKSKYEEQRLEQKFPEYTNYKNKTARFFPWI